MIVLVNPFITSQERYGRDVGDIGGHQMPLGIFSLAGFLRQHGFAVRVIDAEAENIPPGNVVDRLRDLRARIVGITSTTVGYRNAALLAGLLRERLPGVPLVIGGPHLTAMPLKTMQTGLFDFGIVKEGERHVSRSVSAAVTVATVSSRRSGGSVAKVKRRSNSGYSGKPGSLVAIALTAAWPAALLPLP